MAKTQREIAEQQRQLKVITDDQTRLRANLKEMPPTAAAYKRYLEKFDEQETQIEKYQAEIKKLQGIEHTQKKEFETSSPTSPPSERKDLTAENAETQKDKSITLSFSLSAFSAVRFLQVSGPR